MHEPHSEPKADETAQNERSIKLRLPLRLVIRMQGFALVRGQSKSRFLQEVLDGHFARIGLDPSAADQAPARIDPTTDWDA